MKAVHTASSLLEGMTAPFSAQATCALLLSVGGGFVEHIPGVLVEQLLRGRSMVGLID